MNISKLDPHEKLAVYGSVAVVVGVVLSATQYGGAGTGGWLDLLLAIAMLAVVFLPQLSPQTTLPGSKGSLMVAVGGIAAIGAVVSLLGVLSVLGSLFGALYGGLWFIGYLIIIGGGLVMGLAGWRAFQAEGGKFQIGSGERPPGS
jgi:hypothetical protein